MANELTAYDYRSPMNEAAFNAAAQAGRETMQTLLKGRQEAANQAAKEAATAALGNKRQQQAQELYDQYGGKTGVNVSAEGATLSPHDPALKMMQEQKSEGQALSNEFGKVSKKYEPILDRLDIATGGLARGDALGMKQAAVGLAGITEGPTQRLLGTVVQSFGGDPSIVGNSEKLENFVTGLQNSGKSDAFKQSMTEALRHSYAATQSGYGADKSDFMMRAGQFAPHIAATNPSVFGQFGSGLEAKMGKVGDNFSQLDAMQKQAAQQRAQSPAGQSPGPIDRLKSFFNQTPSAAPSVPTPPPGALDIDSFLKSQGGN